MKDKIVSIGWILLIGAIFLAVFTLVSGVAVYLVGIFKGSVPEAEVVLTTNLNDLQFQHLIILVIVYAIFKSDKTVIKSDTKEITSSIISIREALEKRNKE